MASAIAATVPCFHYSEGCSYRIRLVDCPEDRADGEFVHLQLDWRAARIHHRYAHGEELEVELR